MLDADERPTVRRDHSERLAEVAAFAKDLAAAIACLETIAAHPAFAGPSAPHVALREQAETAALRMVNLQDLIADLRGGPLPRSDAPGQ
jgi:hypothetical protein